MKPMTGSDLKAWRAIIGMSQFRAAVALGTTSRTIARWEAVPDRPLPLWPAIEMACFVLSSGARLGDQTKQEVTVPVPDAPMPGLVASLSSEQQAAAIEYKGPEGVASSTPPLLDSREAAIMKLSERAYLATSRDDPEAPSWDTLDKEDKAYFRNIVVTILADRENVTAAMQPKVTT